MPNFALSILAAALLSASCASAEGIYGKNSPVLQIDGKGYDRLIARSIHPSVVEFYAPWCGHCQQFKKAYEKTATALDGLAKVAAVNCDEDKNKAFCNHMGIEGFPTVKIIVPSSKPGQPTIEDYRGKRGPKFIKAAVIERMPNHVKRVTDKNLDEWLAESNSTAKAILFSKKGVTSGILRSLAIDFLGSINIAQARNKEKAVVSMFGVKDFPKLVLLPGGNAQPIVYDGAMEKKPMLAFLSQITAPNPDVPPKTSSPKQEAAMADGEATGQSNQQEKPFKADPIAEMPLISDDSQLQKSCLSKNSRLCILTLVGTQQDFVEKEDASVGAQKTLWEVVHRHTVNGELRIPAYAVSTDLASVKDLMGKLSLEDNTVTTILAVNAKRGWWSKYEPGTREGDAYSKMSLEAWIDQIKMGEGKREILPPDAIAETATRSESQTEYPTGHREEL